MAMRPALMAQRFTRLHPRKPNGLIFFQFIQCKGDDGFDEGNFWALIESIGQDQIDHGVRKVV